MNGVDMRYIGACKLLARLAARDRVTDEDRILVKNALDDCAASYPGRFEVVPTTHGHSLEPVARGEDIDRFDEATEFTEISRRFVGDRPFQQATPKRRIRITYEVLDEDQEPVLRRQRYLDLEQLCRTKVDTLPEEAAAGANQFWLAVVMMGYTEGK